MGRLFGTDGVRGIANTELSAELALNLGRAGALVLTGHTNNVPRIIVGKDTRISGDMLEAGLIAGFCSVGAQVICVGTLPTPAIAYLIKKYKADAGVVISASHNSMEYNGIKFFNKDGYKLSDELENEIEEYILDGKEIGQLPFGAGVGKVSRVDTGKRDYADFVKSTVSADFSGLRIAVDCANGASYECAKLVFKELGADVVLINNVPNGTNINDNCGSTHMEGLQKFVVEHNCHLGLALDGDADRLLAVDEKGNIVDGDKIMILCAGALKEKGRLKNNTLVATVMSNIGFFKTLEKEGILYEQTKVGDRYVLEKMLEKGYCIGGEQSGHIIFLDYNSTGDGLLTAVQLTQALAESGKSMSEYAGFIRIYPQVLENAKIRNEYKSTYMDIPEIASAVKDLEAKYENNGRLLIRPSGTEPLVRVMIEGDDAEEISADAKRLAQLMEERLG